MAGHVDRDRCGQGVAGCGRSGEEPVGASPTTRDGIAALVGRSDGAAPRLMVLEATGGHETAVAAALAAAGLAVAVVNPRQVRDFAKATGQLAKTDALDARVLALFAARVQPPARPLPDATTPGIGGVAGPAAATAGDAHRRAEPPPHASPRACVPALEEHVAWLRPADRRAGRRAGPDAARQPGLAEPRSGCCAPSPASGRWWRARCWGSCPSWARWIGRRWRPWPGWRPLNQDSGRAPRANGAPGAGGLRCAPRCTWPPSPPSAQPGHPRAVYARLREQAANRRRWRWSPACASC